MRVSVSGQRGCLEMNKACSDVSAGIGVKDWITIFLATKVLHACYG